jgi:thiamine biosynthesis lipoprotein
MGTTYSVKLVFKHTKQNNIKIKNSIDSLLFNLNQQMSTWIKESEISIFNENLSTEPQKISDDFFYVLEQGKIINQKTGGMFDYTIFPIMDLWGFGPSANKEKKTPNKDEIENVLRYVGTDKIQLNHPYIKKLNPKIQLDLNAIAKGYAVDKIHDWLVLKGFSNIFVEIGGEVRCSGVNASNSQWLIGIDTPVENSLPGQKLFSKTILNNESMATSGNYRNFRSQNGKIINHTIDPISGFPLETNVVSVSVKADKCLTADAWATALMVLSFEAGMKKVEEDETIEALWIILGKRGDFKQYSSSSFFYKD